MATLGTGMRGGISGEPETLRASWCENPMNLKTVERRGTAGPESIGAEGELIPSREQSMSHGAAEEGEEDADKRMMMPNVTRRCGGLLGILSPQLDKRSCQGAPEKREAKQTKFPSQA